MPAPSPSPAVPAGGRLDLPPPDDAYLDLPADFGRRVAVFVDTEEEFDWTKPTSREERSTGAAESLPIMHKRLRGYGVEPIYLIDHPIASDLRCVSTLREFQEAGECTVGTQLHSWVNPPFEEEVNRTNSFPGNLPIELERAKLIRLTDTIENGFGRRPIVYRAGRYGVGPNTAALLAELGYRADVSVRATFDYRHEGGPNFSRMRPFPYRLDNGLIEIPLTAGYVGGLRSHGSSLFQLAGRIPRLRGLLARSGLLGRVALTPEGMPLADVRDVVDCLLDDDVRLFSISFHSPSVEPGHTPYVRDAHDLDLFYAWWDGIFDHLGRRGIAPASMDECLQAIAGARPLR
jgi:hypothetical protein